jgi:hypothetical protein
MAMKKLSPKLCWLPFVPAVLVALLAVPAGRAEDPDFWKREEYVERQRREYQMYCEEYKRLYGHPPPDLPPILFEGQDLYAVITYSPATRTAGTSKVWTSLGSAQRMAKMTFRAPDARPVVWVKNGYCALAVGKDGSYGTGYAPTLEQAKEIALRECRKRTSDCEIAAWVFSGRNRANAAVAGGVAGPGGGDLPGVRRVRQ